MRQCLKRTFPFTAPAFALHGTAPVLREQLRPFVVPVAVAQCRQQFAARQCRACDCLVEQRVQAIKRFGQCIGVGGFEFVLRAKDSLQLLRPRHRTPPQELPPAVPDSVPRATARK